MKNAASFLTARLLGATLLLTAAVGCKKDNPAPSNTSLLTGPTWRTTDVRLTINGVEGAYTPSPADDTKFTADGNYTNTPVGGSASTGTWAFLSNETQLQQTSSGSTSTTDPYQLTTLTSTDLALGYTYTQAQVQHAINNNNTSPTTTDRTVLLLVLSAGSFKFPNNTLPINSAADITSLSLRRNYKAQ